MKQLADSDIVHVHGGADFEGGSPGQSYGPSEIQVVHFLASLANPQAQHPSD